jgi:hypothetical protein
LPVTTFSEDQCAKIMMPVLRHALPGAGFVRTLPRTLVHGPLKYQGLAVPDLYTIQGVDHINRILKYSTAAEVITGQLIRASMEELQLEIGITGPIMSLDFATYGILATKCWLLATWKFLSEKGMRMEDDGPPLILRRQEDQFLMQAFAKQGFLGGLLVQLNRCRCHLRVVTMSDIATACGTKLTSFALKGIPDETRKPTYHCPRTAIPSQADWGLWKKALKSFCHADGTLQRPLFLWTDDPMTWNWFFSSEEERLYTRLPTGQ